MIGATLKSTELLTKHKFIDTNRLPDIKEELLNDEGYHLGRSKSGQYVFFELPSTKQKNKNETNGEKETI
ncbi:hypothetical protein OGZ37_04345 [Lactococcus lactis]|jgi:hypothetical protein|uniref:Uncharacterized protein n=1 Tax=Lactococcus lactis subsp. lactis TaxID=1360 RepID=A0A2Z3KQH5_LACLL|nr:hypothetical protein [Lactococcus lactis]AWN66593.1 hypothetical protein LL14B4_10560 [Lactococcus lactis subsp. lactis]MDG4965809.1 hypothetical protein [Lactococcus lactis]